MAKETDTEAETPGAADTAAAAAPLIRRLRIEGFRGIRKLDWWPAVGVNVVLGGGDFGKTTILEAIALLLSPTNGAVASDTDYFERNKDNGFLIRAVLSLPPDTGVHVQSEQCYPWAWDGQKAVAPVEPEDGSVPPDPEIPVYKVQVRGTPELDLEYDMECPNGSVSSFPPSLRREIGLVRLAGDDRGDRDLRLVQGSALDRLLSDKALRGRLAVGFSQDDVKDNLDNDGKAALEQLDESFRKQQLPHQLGLGLNVGQGQSVSALIGLTARPGNVRLPLASWGAGTRRLASLAVARACRTGCPVMLIDEAERGLEPYRQRLLAMDLSKGPSQVFMTTHSAAVLSACKPATVWHLTGGQEIGSLASFKTATHRARDPETFLSRLPIIAEGSTEVGFVSELLTRQLGVDLLEVGVHVSDAVGNDFARVLMGEMAKARFRFGGFVDNEGADLKSWEKLKGSMGDLLMQWENGCTETNIIAHLPADQLRELIEGDDDAAQQRITTLVERLKYLDGSLTFPKHSLDAVMEAAGENLMDLVQAAACGDTPEGMDQQLAKTWKKHARVWFKSEAGGRELAGKMFSLGTWPKLEPQLAPFVEAVRAAVMATDTGPAGA